MTPDKQAARAAARATRAARSVKSLERDGRLLARAVLGLPDLEGVRTVSAYVAIGREPSTSVLLAGLLERGVTVLLPVVLPDLDLDWCLDDGTRARGAGPGVPEPQGPRLGREAVAWADLLLVPALLVDRSGRRLGQGGGSFDRALARARPDTTVVALVHDDELVDGPLPVEPHDRPVDVVVTPTRVHRVGG